jgi:hypothetical protein
MFKLFLIVFLNEYEELNRVRNHLLLSSSVLPPLGT